MVDVANEEVARVAQITPLIGRRIRVDLVEVVNLLRDGLPTQNLFQQRRRDWKPRPRILHWLEATGRLSKQLASPSGAYSALLSDLNFNPRVKIPQLRTSLQWR